MIVLKKSIKKYYTMLGKKTKFLILLIFMIQFSISDRTNLSAKDESLTFPKLSYNDSETLFDLSKYYFYSESGKSSWYGKKFHNRKTASGEIYNMYEFTAAHKSLPFGTIVRVNNLENDKSFIVRINDRGPFIKSRIIDLSYSSALETNSMGTPAVIIEALKANDNEIMEKLPNTEYYFCYSFNLPLVTLPEGTLKKLASTIDFDESIILYKRFTELYPSKKIYLAVESDYLEQKNSMTSYFICYYDPSDFKPNLPIADNLVK
jgi:3D (Asp-Asp-Asp) domain-containing protein